jgi:hypothetical protein
VQDGLEQMLSGMPGHLRDRVAGLGIAIPFELWNWTEQAGAPREEMDLWRDCDLRTELAAICEMPVYLQNDATAACAAELVFGQHRGFEQLSLSLYRHLCRRRRCAQRQHLFRPHRGMPARSDLCRFPGLTASWFN